MDNFDKIIIALAYHTNAMSTLIPEISTFIANEDIKPETPYLGSKLYTRGHCSKLNATMEKDCQAAEERTKAKLTQKEKWFKENWNFEYKQRINEENKTNLQQHKDLESGSRKSGKIPKGFF